VNSNWPYITRFSFFFNSIFAFAFGNWKERSIHIWLNSTNNCLLTSVVTVSYWLRSVGFGSVLS